MARPIRKKKCGLYRIFWSNSRLRKCGPWGDFAPYRATSLGPAFWGQPRGPKNEVKNHARNLSSARKNRSHRSAFFKREIDVLQVSAQYHFPSSPEAPSKYLMSRIPKIAKHKMSIQGRLFLKYFEPTKTTCVSNSTRREAQCWVWPVVFLL